MVFGNIGCTDAYRSMAGEMMFTIRYIGNRLVVRGCTPHYRRPLPEIVEFRRQMAEQLRGQGIPLPITRQLKLSLLAKRHSDGGDIANLLQGLVQALDGHTLGRENAILDDDKLINQLHAQWI